MSLVRLLGFTTLRCGCVVGRYREVATSREVTYVEEKGKTCVSQGHRRNHTVKTADFSNRVGASGGEGSLYRNDRSGIQLPRALRPQLGRSP